MILNEIRMSVLKIEMEEQGSFTIETYRDAPRVIVEGVAHIVKIHSDPQSLSLDVPVRCEVPKGDWLEVNNGQNVVLFRASEAWLGEGPMAYDYSARPHQAPPKGRPERKKYLRPSEAPKLKDAEAAAIVAAKAEKEGLDQAAEVQKALGK